ncbi:GAF and ANTAR domain-containing protein [uncultured Arthrobacter sp.]|uniref:GAF and ANTAR domain-containing protein n=1 Tax=uncultured Arthrobacter sp. TaxID=114050 RepID=UPI002609ECC3|nr:GAF and ANTAR domain-containing protein [uncultured Arthrobacter sp.]
MDSVNVGRPMAEHLQDLLISSDDTDRFLHDLAIFSSKILGADVLVHCGVTLVRQKRPTTVASSSEAARKLDEIQYGYDEGPCLNAIATQQTTVITDVRTDDRWPAYFSAVKDEGFYSMLGVPLFIGARGGAALNFYAQEPNTFTPDVVETAEAYAAQAAKALQLAVRVAAQTDRANDLEAAMRSRTTIDLAAGIIMAQNRCTQEEAIEILHRASSQQNVKLREIAERIVQNVSGGSANTYFDA